MIRRLIILLLIVGCEDETTAPEPEDVYGCTDSDAVNFSPNATVSDSTCEYSVYGGYPDFETICGMDEFANPTENMGDGICGLCIGEQDSIAVSMWQFTTETFYELFPDMDVYPNPFNSITYVNFKIAEESDITIYILNIDYNILDILIQQSLYAGVHSYLWDATSFADGYYRIVVDFGEVECFYNVHKKPYP